MDASTGELPNTRYLHFTHNDRFLTLVFEKSYIQKTVKIKNLTNARVITTLGRNTLE